MDVAVPAMGKAGPEMVLPGQVMSHGSARSSDLSAKSSHGSARIAMDYRTS